MTGVEGQTSVWPLWVAACHRSQIVDRSTVYCKRRKCPSSRLAQRAADVTLKATAVTRQTPADLLIVSSVLFSVTDRTRVPTGIPKMGVRKLWRLWHHIAFREGLFREQWLERRCGNGAIEVRHALSSIVLSALFVSVSRAETKTKDGGTGPAAHGARQRAGILTPCRSPVTTLSLVPAHPSATPRSGLSTGSFSTMRPCHSNANS